MCEEEKKEGFVYIASPYSSDDALLRKCRIMGVTRYASACLQLGETVFSPVVYGLAVMRYGAGSMDVSWESWSQMCLDMLSRARELRILKLPGWSESRGVREELKAANEWSIPVTYDGVNSGIAGIIWEDLAGGLVWCEEGVEGDVEE